jgi:hypothetical protein
LSYPNFADSSLGLDLNSQASAANDSPSSDQISSDQPPAQHQEQERKRREKEGRGGGRSDLVSRVIVPLPPVLPADSNLRELSFDEEGNLSVSAWEFVGGGSAGGKQQTNTYDNRQALDKESNAGSKPQLNTPNPKKKTRSQSRSRLFGRGRYNRHLIWPLIVGGLIVGYLIWLFFYLSTPVKVVVQVGFQREVVRTQSISLALDLTRSTEGSLTILQSPLPLSLEANNSQLASYFKTVEVSTTFTVTTVTTGKKLVPDKTASGQIELGSRNTATLPAGAIVARVGTVEYRLARAVAIPGYDFISGRGGTAVAPVTASVPGSVGNARLGVSLLDSFGYPGVAVRGGNVTGGTDREVQVVAQQDLARLRLELDASLAPTGTVAASLRANAQSELAKSKVATTSPTSSAITDGQPAGAGLLVLSLAEFGTGALGNGNSNGKEDATVAGAGVGFKEVSELDETSLQIIGRDYGYSSPNVPGDEATQIVATLTAKARAYVVEPQGLVEYLSQAQSLGQGQGQGQSLDNTPNQVGSSHRPLFRSTKLEREGQLTNGKIGLKLTVSYSLPVTPAQRQEIVTRLANWRGNAAQLTGMVQELTNKPGVAYIELPKLPEDVSSRNNLELIVVVTPPPAT